MQVRLTKIGAADIAFTQVASRQIGLVELRLMQLRFQESRILNGGQMHPRLRPARFNGAGAVQVGSNQIGTVENCFAKTSPLRGGLTQISAPERGCHELSPIEAGLEQDRLIKLGVGGYYPFKVAATQLTTGEIAARKIQPAKIPPQKVHPREALQLDRKRFPGRLCLTVAN